MNFHTINGEDAKDGVRSACEWKNLLTQQLIGTFYESGKGKAVKEMEGLHIIQQKMNLSIPCHFLYVIFRIKLASNCHLLHSICHFHFFS